MRTAFRIVALFAAYSVIGLIGDYGIGLLAGRGDVAAATAVSEDADAPAVSEEVDAPAVVVDVRPEIVTRAQVRRSEDCSFALDRELTVPVTDVSRVAIHAGSGELRVEGREDLDEIVAVGSVCASDEAYLDDLTISAESTSDQAVTIETHYPDRSGWRSGTARIDLAVFVPLGMAVDIDDSSGEIVAMRTGDLRIEDSSGSIEASEVDGSLVIDDSSGGVDVRRVFGDVTVEDGSGGIELREITGSVSLRDGSGGIEVVGVGGSVVVESDGSGSIDVRDVHGDFVVRRDGSGGIRYSGVEGAIDIPRKR